MSETGGRLAAAPPPADGAASRRPTPGGEPISPELVLVSPRLRLKALAALPERPWEAFLPPPAPPPTEPATVALAAAPAAEAAPEPTPYPTEPPAREHRRGRVVSLLAAGFAAGFLVAEVVPRAEGPALVEPAPQSQASAPSTKPAAQPEPPPPPAATTRAQPPPPPPARSAPRRVIPIAGGGYVFGRWGRFRVSANSRAITGFEARVRCARSVGIRQLRLRSGRFAYQAGFRLRAGGFLRVSIGGRFVDRTLARGFVRARSPRCDSGRVRFVARLS